MGVVFGQNWGWTVLKNAKNNIFLEDFSIFFEINKKKTLKEKGLPHVLDTIGVIQDIFRYIWTKFGVTIAVKCKKCHFLEFLERNQVDS